MGRAFEARRVGVLRLHGDGVRATALAVVLRVRGGIILRGSMEGVSKQEMSFSIVGVVASLAYLKFSISPRIYCSSTIKQVSNKHAI